MIYGDKKESISLGVRIIIAKNNQVVIVRQRKLNNRDVYIFPGGGIQKGEDIFSAAERELKEETHLRAKIAKLLYIKELFSPGLHSIEFYVLARAVKGRLKLGIDPELADNRQVLQEVLWMSMSQLKKLNFYPKELREKLYSDWKSNFENITSYLGAETFSLKQYNKLFGPKKSAARSTRKCT